MQIKYSKKEQLNRIIVNCVYGGVIIVWLLFLFLNMNRINELGAGGIALGISVIALIAYVIRVIFTNREVLITESGVVDCLFFGKIKRCCYRWDEFVYVGKIKLARDVDTYTCLICATEKPKWDAESMAYQIERKKAVLIEDLDENYLILSPYFKGVL